MLWKGFGGLRTDAGQDPLELHDVFLDATDDVNESFIVVPGWIWQIPIIVESLADIGTSHVAAMEIAVSGFGISEISLEYCVFSMSMP